MEHWLVKALVFKILHDRSRTIMTEAETGNCIVDVLDADNSTAYEIETSPTERMIKQKVSRLWHLHDVFIIDIRKIPDSLEKAVKYLDKVVLT